MLFRSDGYVIYDENTKDLFIVDQGNGLYEIFVGHISTGMTDDISGEPFESVPIIPKEIWQKGRVY